MRSRVYFRAAALLLSSLLVVAAPSKSDRIDFDRQIRPILSDKCFTCHGPDDKNRMAGLRFDRKDGGAFDDRGGYHVITPGDSANSRMYQRISAEKAARRMPPPYANATLTSDQINLIKTWIDQGAKWEVHWAYVPPKRPALPKVSNSAWVRNPIDAFVLARLDAEGLKPSPEADRVTLIRRVSFDLTGLPPTPAEVDAFLADNAPDAYEKVVDRLLHSPRYGERMAMQWLDLARYADTHGYHIDSQREMWHWRDWVIDAFNRNLPYDQFTIDQLAGDLLPHPTTTQLIATGFNRNHMINFEGGAIPEEYQNEYVVDRVEATSTTWLGLTMGCARCHDHKYDPISQKEFYRFYAFFNTIDEKGLDGQRGNAKPILELPSPDQKAKLDQLDAAIKMHHAALPEEAVAAAQTKWEAERLGTIPESPRNGLLAWYELDGNLSDITGNYRHGRVLKGNPSWEDGIIGKAADFDGQTQVSFPRMPIGGDKPFAISMWLSPSGKLRNAVFTKETPDGRGFELALDDYLLTDIQHWSPRIFVRLGGKGKDALEVATRDRLSADWYHVTLNYDGSGKASGVEIWLNGERAKTEVLHDALSGPVANAAPLEIGNLDFGKRFGGSLDDLRFYSRTLQPAEIHTLAILDPVRALLVALPANRSNDQKDRLRDYFLTNEAPAPYRTAWTQLKTLEQQQKDLKKALPTTMVMAEMEKPRETAILARGDYRNRGEVVTPGVPAVLPPLPKDAPVNRLTLAKWLVDPSHPLTSRVAVNRFWQMYFGNGIVKTSQDFGSQGDPPIHPELLDWLATEFIRTGWDIRAMQRLIVTSATYRQSSRVTPELLEKDPENRLLARGPRFRLPAEMVRDNALAAAGLLRERVGGPSVFPYQPPGLWEEVSYGDGFSAQTFSPSRGDDLYRRSMYTFWKRSSPPPALITFDAPDREKCTARRGVTNTPLQALVLLNDPTYVEAARALAERTLHEPPARRIDFAFRMATSREPTPGEARLLRILEEKELATYRANPADASKLLAVGESKCDPHLKPAELAAWTTVASTILNLDETITKE